MSWFISKIPHMGWNELTLARHGRDHPVLAGLGSGTYAYFVHSYELRPRHEDELLATVDNGGPVSAVVGRANLVGTQFHPEKSQSVGLRLIANFLRWRPEQAVH
jgi:glutamine amidotransferase